MFRLTVQGTSLSLPTLSYSEVVEACRQQNIPLDLLAGCSQLSVNEFGEETAKVLLNGPELAALDAIGFDDLKGRVSLVNSTVTTFSSGGFNAYNTFRVRPLLSPIAVTRLVGSIFIVELAGPWYWFDKCPSKNTYPEESTPGFREPISGGVYNKTRHTTTETGFWYHENTTKTSTSPYTAKEIIEDLFSHATGIFNNTFPTLSGVTVVGNSLNHAISNFYVGNKSVWQAIKEIVKLFRAGIYVNASGNLVITPYLTTANTFNGSATLTSRLSANELDYPSKVTVRYENYEYQHFNFESDIIIGSQITNYPLPYADTDTTVIGGGYPNQIITAPYVRNLPGLGTTTNLLITSILQNLLDFYVSPSEILTSVNDFPILYNRPLRAVLSMQKGYLEFDVRTQIDADQYHELPFHHYEKELIRELWVYKDSEGSGVDIYYPHDNSILRKTGVTLENALDAGESEDEFNYCLQIGERYYAISKQPAEITVINTEPCDSNTVTYSESVDQLTFRYGLKAASGNDGAVIDLDVTLLGQEQVPLPCGCGDARFSWDGTQWNLVSGCDGPRCSAPDPPAPPATECSTATFLWTGSAWQYVSGCTGATCAIPPPPTGTGSFIGDTEAVPCDVADVFLPCTGGDVDLTEITEYNQIEFLGNLTCKLSLEDPCRVEVRGTTIFAVHGAEATENCDPECGEALFVWVTTPSPEWELVTPCGGLRCQTPEPPPPPEDQTTPGQTITVPCIGQAEEIREVCINTEALEFSEKFSVGVQDNRTYIDIDLCRLFDDPFFKDFLCDAVEECLEDRFDGLCEELEECIDERINNRLQELCSSTNVLVPIDENTAATVDDAETRIEFKCQTIHFVTCPDKESEPTEECGPRYIEGTNCPEDEEDDDPQAANVITMLLEKVQQLETRIAELEAR
jgi:hypothetical protein